MHDVSQEHVNVSRDSIIEMVSAVSDINSVDEYQTTHISSLSFQITCCMYEYNLFIWILGST